MTKQLKCPTCLRALKIAANNLSGECSECKTTFYFSREEYEQLVRPELRGQAAIRIGDVEISSDADRYLLKRIGELSEEIESLRAMIDVLSHTVEDIVDKGDIKKN
jgi:hypothetical protein